MTATAPLCGRRVRQGSLGSLGRVLLQGGFSVWSSHKGAPAARMREMARFKGARRHVFLYERALVCCKRRDDRGRSPVYSFKSGLEVRTARPIAENPRPSRRGPAHSAARSWPMGSILTRRHKSKRSAHWLLRADEFSEPGGKRQRGRQEV